MFPDALSIFVKKFFYNNCATEHWSSDGNTLSKLHSGRFLVCPGYISEIAAAIREPESYCLEDTSNTGDLCLESCNLLLSLLRMCIPTFYEI